jgi:L-glutamine-phosphate cytidylyltransferase
MNTSSKAAHTQLFILCAGEGKRLRPYTEHQPKCMVPYKGQSLLQYQLSACKQLKIHNITLIGGYCADKLPQSYPIVINKDYASTNMLHSLFCAESDMNEAYDWIISYGDIIYAPSVLEKLLEADDPMSIITDLDWQTYWEERMEDPLKDAETFKWDPKSRYIKDLGQKPKELSDIQGQYIGLFKISSSYTKTFKELYHQFCTEEPNFRNAYITDFLQYLIQNKQPLLGVPIHNQWAEFDRPEDLTIDLKFL